MKVHITCKYGEKDYLHPHGHSGIDINFHEGTPIHAIKSGVAHVVDYGNKNIGKGVIIEHTDGSKEIYGHLSKFKIEEGQQIYAGDQIGLSGNTGHSTGPHLHFGMKDSHNHFIDPTHHYHAIVNQSRNIHWYDVLTTKKGLLYDVAADPKGWLYEQVSKFIEGGWLHFGENCISAFPVCAVVGCSVYFLIRSLSKKLAKASFIATMIFGMIVANT